MTIDTMANVILNNCENVSNKKLQKLSYYVYSWYLTLFNQKIVNEKFEAWEHGPVCRKLYNQYKRFGWNVIPKYEGFVLASDEEIEFIQRVLSIYGMYSANELEEMTHLEAPWIKARNAYGANTSYEKFISDLDIVEYYSGVTDIKNMLKNQIA